MTTYRMTPLAISIHPEGENPIYGKRATHVCIEDEVGGAFVVITQTHDDANPGEVRLDPDELPLILQAATKLLADYPEEKDDE